VLVLLQLSDTMSPSLYYVASACGGLVSWLSIALSSLSDVMPKQWRAPMFGLLLSGFSLGFALSPIIAVFCTHFVVSVLSLSILVLSLGYSICFLPETVRPQQAIAARLQRVEYRLDENESKVHCISRGILRPFKELSILNRNDLFRLLSVLAFCSGMSTSADQTLLIYYVEDRLEFNDHDIAILFGMIGVIGVLVQGVVLKQLTDLIGERFVVVVAFICGAVTNVLYSFANTKQIIFFAVVVSSFTGMSFPTISAIKANNADESEQGRIQGALYALSSLANALGPVLLRLAYQYTMNTKYPGSFFLVATVFFTVAVFCGYTLPKDKANARRRSESGTYNEIALIESTEIVE
jgi:DHA1 family tetracycline resistance protein-like MFS transporter